MHEQLEMLKKYPGLLPTTKDFTSYEGFIRAGDEEFPIGLRVPNYPSLADLSLCCSWKLGYILRGSEDDLRDCITSYPTLLEYLSMLQHLIVSRLQSPLVSSLLYSGRRPPYDTYRRVFEELEGVGSENVVHISHSLDEVRLRSVDRAGREHILTVGRLSACPTDLDPRADLPAQAMHKMDKNQSLVRLYQSFEAQLAELQEFWDILEELDRECWIIDPDVPNRSHTYRRIVLGSNVSIQLTVDPYNARLRPDVKFLGSEMAIRPLQKSLAETYEDWSPRCSFTNNLLDSLDLSEFPERPEVTADEMQLVRPGECCVCYMTRAEDGQLPSEACDNNKCGSHFHQSCLYQWLTTVPTNNKSFNRIFGQCPNCDWPISCSTVPMARPSTS